jgi:hypothetical protein
MHPGRIWRPCEGDNKNLLKVKENSYKRSWWASWEPEAEREPFFQMSLKPMLTYGKVIPNHQ